VNEVKIVVDTDIGTDVDVERFEALFAERLSTRG